MNRGHLLGDQLGGSGTDRRNLVALHGVPNRKPYMAKVESEVAAW
ncbi:DNA/RNA non-specific endonuclease [Streptomyces sp. RS2]